MMCYFAPTSLYKFSFFYVACSPIISIIDFEALFQTRLGLSLSPLINGHPFDAFLDVLNVNSQQMLRFVFYLIAFYFVPEFRGFEKLKKKS